MIYIDTGAFIARYIRKDQYHDRSVKLWEQILSGRKLFTSNHILDETITFFMRCIGSGFAVEKANILYQTDAYKTLYSDFDVEKEGVKILAKYQDQKLSFTDCISVVLMKKNNIKNIFTFDNHFKLFGFKILP